MNSTKLLLSALFLLFSSGAVAEAEGEFTSPGHLAIQVNGIVCSFCAYGTEKNLARLDFLDKTQFGKDGVLVDIKAHRITLALQKDKPVRYEMINAAILKGGYDPVAYYASIKGVVRQSTEGFQLLNEDNGQIYSLPDHPDMAGLAGQTIVIQTELNPQQAGQIIPNQVIHLTSIEHSLESSIVPQP